MITIILGTILFYKLAGLSLGYSFLVAWFLYCLFREPRDGE